MKTVLLKMVLSSIAITILYGCANPEKSRRREAARQVDAAFEVWVATLPEENADYGRYPVSYEELAAQRISQSLKDPETARFSDYSKPRKEYAMRNHKVIYGYSFCLMVNAKNSYGGYVGKQPYWVFMRDGEIIRVQAMNDMLGNMVHRLKKVDCRDGT